VSAKRKPLSITHPELAKQAVTHGGRKPISKTHPRIATQADGWDPTTLTPGSNRRVGWRCKKGHRWIEAVYTRASGSQCPYCSNNKVLTGFNDLQTKFPKLAKQAHRWDPSCTLPRGNKPVKWQCESGHVWESSIYRRISLKSGCPICSGKKSQAGFNDLKTIHPAIAKQADGWDPRTVRPGSNKKVRWKCSKGHLWVSAIVDRTGQGQGCSYCTGKRVLKGFNDLVTTHPEIAGEAFGWNPDELSKGSQQKKKWKCLHGHSWLASPGSRTRGTGCPVCSGNVVLPRYNDLNYRRPEIAAQADGWDPSTVIEFSTHKRKWKCPVGHTWTAAVSNRSAGDTGCPICAGQEMLVGFNDLVTTHPELAKQADGWNPNQERASRHVKKNWLGTCGHRWIAPISARAYGGFNCPYCSGKRTLKGFNDLATTHPEVARQADGWDPTTVTNGSGLTKPWRCQGGHTWRAKVAARVDRGDKRGNDCPYCSGNKLLVGFNDLATTYPTIAAQAHGWDPTSVTRGSHSRRTWECENDHKWKATVHDRTSGTGCPSCAKGGFDPNEEGWLYFLDHPDWDLYQIGITNKPDDRLGDHQRIGWTTLEIRGPMDGNTVRELETAILQHLRRSGAIMANRTDIQKFDGWTEAWTKKSFRVNRLRELIDDTLKLWEGVTD